MIQVWHFDENKIYIGSGFINKEDFNEQEMTTVPLNTNFLCVKPLFNGEEWVEGGTVDEIKKWKDSQIVNTEPSEIKLLKQDNLILNEAVTEMTMLISMILEGMV